MVTSKAKTIINNNIILKDMYTYFKVVKRVRAQFLVHFRGKEIEFTIKLYRQETL